MKSPRGRGGGIQPQNFPKAVERVIYDHHYWKGQDHPHLYENLRFDTPSVAKMYKNFQGNAYLTARSVVI